MLWIPERRHSQVAKATDCKSVTHGSSPGAASISRTHAPRSQSGKNEGLRSIWANEPKRYPPEVRVAQAQSCLPIAGTTPTITKQSEQARPTGPSPSEAPASRRPSVRPPHQFQRMETPLLKLDPDPQGPTELWYHTW